MHVEMSAATCSADTLKSAMAVTAALAIAYALDVRTAAGSS